MDLCDLNTIRLLLGRHGFRFSRSMGQNFLIEGWVPDGLVEGAGVSLQNGVLEIGPGIGPLTMRLSNAATKVVAVELDLVGCKQYIKVTVTPGGSAAATYALVLGDPARMPVEE